MAMEAPHQSDDLDNLDNLIAESLAGVDKALDGDRNASPAQADAANSAGEAVRELQKGPAKEGEVANEVFFSNLVKSFEDKDFQESMAKALQFSDEKEPAGEKAASGPTASVEASSSEGAEDFLKNFMKSFENAAGSDDKFTDQMTSLVTSMLSKDVIVEPLQQIADALEPWLKDQKDLKSSDRGRYESQLKLYKEIINIYKNVSDPVPEDAQQEVHKLLADLHLLGEPPAEVMKQIAPKEAENGEESFEDFVKSMGLGDNLGAAEQDILKKLTEDPEELTKVMKDMAGKLGEEGSEEACKQQ